MTFISSQFPFYSDIISAGGKLYPVGGSVRDTLMGHPIKDYDMLVEALPLETLITTLKKTGHVNVVGKSFGVIKYKAGADHTHEYDLSLPRKEISTGSGHKDFKVEFDHNLKVTDDLGRRDFTVNAIAFDLANNTYIDPFGGIKDLHNKTLRQVFKNTFTEDPLRLIRAVQFAARFNLTIEPETLSGMKEHAALIKTVSKERIIGEIRKLFLAEKPSLGFDIMRETGILPILFPFVHEMIGVLQPMKKNEDVYQHTMKVLDASRHATEMENPGDLNIMFAALLHDTGKPHTVGFSEEKQKTTFYNHHNVSRRIAKNWLNEYKATTIGVDIGKVLNLVGNHMFEAKSFYSDKAIRRFVSKVGVGHIYDLIDLRIADKKGGKFPDSMRGIMNLRVRIKEELAKQPAFTPKDLALNGHDLMARGYAAGPILGEIQKYLIEKVIDDPSLNTVENLDTLIKENFPL